MKKATCLFSMSWKTWPFCTDFSVISHNHFILLSEFGQSVIRWRSPCCVDFQTLELKKKIFKKVHFWGEIDIFPWSIWFPLHFSYIVVWLRLWLRPHGLSQEYLERFGQALPCGIVSYIASFVHFQWPQLEETDLNMQKNEHERE